MHNILVDVWNSVYSYCHYFSDNTILTSGGLCATEVFLIWKCSLRRYLVIKMNKKYKEICLSIHKYNLQINTSHLLPISAFDSDPLVLYTHSISLCFMCLQCLQLASSCAQVMQYVTKKEPTSKLKVSMHIAPKVGYHMLMSHLDVY